MPPPPPMPLLPASRGEAPGRDRLVGRKVIVVGGGQRVFDAATDPVGNGRAICRLFAREGASVAVVDANEESAAATLAQVIDDEGGAGVAIRADVREEQDVVRMFDTAQEKLGGVDAVVFNVGITSRTGDDVSVEEWDNVLAVNLRGAMLVCREAAERLPPGGSIVMISSGAGYTGGSRMIAYDASKSGMRALMRNFAITAGRRDIRVNIVVPGLIDTAVGRFATAQRPNRGRGETLPFRREGTAWEVAYAALFLVSDESAYVNALELAVDSGHLGI